MSKKVCGSSPSFWASTNASQVAAMVAPRIMLLQILAAWPAPGPPAWITALPIFSRYSRAFWKPSLLLSFGFDHFGRRIVDGRAVDQDRGLGGIPEDLSAIDVGHMLAGRQHGDDRVGVLAGFRGGPGALTAMFGCSGEGVFAKVEG